MNQKAEKAILDQLYNTSKYNLVGNIFMLSLVLFILSDIAQQGLMVSYAVVHIFILGARAYSIMKYSRVNKSSLNQKTLDYWLKIFQIGATLTGTMWGIVFFIFEGIPIEYVFIIFAIIIGNVSIGLLGLGIKSSVYYAYLIPIMGITILWMLLQGEEIYTATGIVAILGMIYYAIFTQKYAKNFNQILVDQETINNNLTKIEASQKKNIKLRERTELALKGSNTSVLDWDYVTNDSYISPSWKEMLGFSDATADNDFKTWKERVHKDDLRSVLLKIKQAINKKKTYYETSHRLRHVDGHYIWILDLMKN